MRLAVAAILILAMVPCALALHTQYRIASTSFPWDIHAGSRVHASFVVTNGGSDMGPSATFRLRLNDELVAERHVERLAPGERKTVEGDAVVPFAAAGRWSIYLQVDGQEDKLEEWVEYAIDSPERPLLTITSTISSPAPVVGDFVSFTAVVNNTGWFPSGPVVMEWHSDPRYIEHPVDAPLVARAFVSALPANTSIPLTSTSWRIPEGEFSIVAIARYGNATFEGDRIPIAVPRSETPPSDLPDLAIVSRGPTPSDVIVANLGQSTSPSTSLLFAGDPSARTIVPALEPSAQMEIHESNYTGDGFFGVIVDPDNIVAELSEVNNELREWTIHATPSPNANVPLGAALVVVAGVAASFILQRRAG